MQGEVAAGGATPRSAGEDVPQYSGSKPYLHHEFGRAITPGLAEIVAEALSRGLLITGGTYRLCGSHLRREGAR